MTGLRRAVQVASLGLFVGIFLLATLGAPTWAPPANALFRLSPLDALVARCVRGEWLPVFLPALMLAGLTLLFGRFFCGWVCPTGTLLDIGARVVGAPPRAPSTPRKRWKYLVLLGIVVASVCGASPGWAFDPAGVFYRFLLALFPGLLLGWRAALPHVPRLALWPLAPTAEIVFVGSVGVALLTFGLVGLERIERRFWCRNLCPLGALLALLSRFSLVRREVLADCNQCGACQRVCKMDAAQPTARDHSPSECVACQACTGPCARKAVRFRLGLPDLAGIGLSGGDTSPARARPARREFLLSVAGGATYGVLARTETHTRMPDARLLRPPNALPEAEFNNACIRCGTCMKVCVTNSLQPTMLEAGLQGLWTPRLIPRIGWCDGPCDMCGQACPTGAIRPFRPEEKPKIRLGGAIIDRHRCIAWRDAQQCLVCDEHCFFKAIYWKEVDGLNRPFVDGVKCVGCGICENKCPTVPDPAIVVYALPAGAVSRPDADGTSGYPGGSPAGPGGSPARPGGSPAGPGGSPARPGGSPAGPGGSPAHPGGSPAGPGGSPTHPGGPGRIPGAAPEAPPT